MPAPTLSRSLLRRVLPASAAAWVFGVLAGLHLLGAEAAYRGIIRGWGVAPFRFAFLDTDMVLSGLRCVRLGIDVYVTNPCDALGRIYDYAPLWLALAHTGLAVLPLGYVGLGVDLCFLASLLLLPPARTLRGAVLVTLGVLSTATVFALERGNTDLVIFTLAVGATWLMRRSLALRVVGYGLAMLAGMLKYYPMALAALALRERSRAFAAVAVGIAAAAVAYAALDFADLGRALALIPTGAYFGDMFGARTLPMGMVQRLHPWLGHASGVLLEIALTAGAFLLGGRLGCDDDFRAALARLTEAERITLMTGALLVLGCFFTAQNIGYRAINLLMVLPGLVALRQVGTQRRIYRGAPGLVLLLLWAEGWRHWLHVVARLVLGASNTAVIDIPLWLLREGAWWGAVTLLIGCLVGVVRGLKMGRVVEQWARRGAG